MTSLRKKLVCFLVLVFENWSGIAGLRTPTALTGMMCPWWQLETRSNKSRSFGWHVKQCSGEFTTTPNALPEANCLGKKWNMSHLKKTKKFNNKSNCCHRQSKSRSNELVARVTYRSQQTSCQICLFFSVIAVNGITGAYTCTIVNACTVLLQQLAIIQ